MTANHTARTQVILFLVLTAVSSTVVYVLMHVYGDAVPLVVAMMWCPGIAAMATRLILCGNLRGLGWAWGKWRYQATSYVLPALAAVVVYGFVYVTGLGDVTFSRLDTPISEPLTDLGLGAGAVITLSLIYKAIVPTLLYWWIVLGEEIGWSGLMSSELAGITSPARASLLVGLAWSAWHYPSLFMGFWGHEASQLWYVIPIYTMVLGTLSFLRVWMRLKSGSLWTGVLLHLSHNVFVQEVFNPITVDTGYTRLITTEFGIGLAVVYAVMALFLWRGPQRLRLSTVPGNGRSQAGVTRG